MRYQRLADWLAWQETLHPSTIELGLDRVQQVLARMNCRPVCPVITVAGTKGKGSCVAMLESIYLAGGYRVGAFSSPHLIRYNERIRINGHEVTDDSLCAAFDAVDHARGEVSLTYFEFSTLAAFWLFFQAGLEVWILEVGMGGRLDAVNCVDADVAVVTSIGLDHTEWLGNDLESIAHEKAGIYRAGRPALFGASEMPKAIAQQAQAKGAILIRFGRDYGCSVTSAGWSWWSGRQRVDELPLPGIGGAIQVQNASLVLMVIELLSERLSVSEADLRQGLEHVRLPGRFQCHTTPQGQQWILDVAHNPLSAGVLAMHLRALEPRRTLAVLGVMSDKDLAGMVSALAGQVDGWIVTALPGPRAAATVQVATQLQSMEQVVVAVTEHVEQACQTAADALGQYPRVLVLGSFLTVGPALAWLGC